MAVKFDFLFFFIYVFIYLSFWRVGGGISTFFISEYLKIDIKLAAPGEQFSYND